jgi:hypothetical protein
MVAGRSISPVAVKMQEMIIPGMFFQMGSELVECGWAQNIDVRWQPLPFNQVDERAGDGAIAHIV